MSRDLATNLNKIIQAEFPNTSISWNIKEDISEKLLQNKPLKKFTKKIYDLMSEDDDDVDNLFYLLREGEIDSVSFGIILMKNKWYFSEWGMKDEEVVDINIFNDPVDAYWPLYISVDKGEDTKGFYEYIIFDKENANENELKILIENEEKQSMECACIIYDQMTGKMEKLYAESYNTESLHEKFSNIPMISKRILNKAKKTNEYSTFVSYLYPQENNKMKTELIMVYGQTNIHYRKKNQIKLMDNLYEILMNHLFVDTFRIKTTEYSFFPYKILIPVYLKEIIHEGKKYKVPKLLDSSSPGFIIRAFHEMKNCFGKYFSLNDDEDIIKTKFYKKYFQSKNLMYIRKMIKI